METFKKRQKEMRRLERQRDKTARRMERKLHRGTADDPSSVDVAEAPEAPEAPSDDKPTIETGSPTSNS